MPDHPSSADNEFHLAGVRCMVTKAFRGKSMKTRMRPARLPGSHTPDLEASFEQRSYRNPTIDTCNVLRRGITVESEPVSV